MTIFLRNLEGFKTLIRTDNLPKRWVECLWLFNLHRILSACAVRVFIVVRSKVNALLESLSIFLLVYIDVRRRLFTFTAFNNQIAPIADVITSFINRKLACSLLNWSGQVIYLLCFKTIYMIWYKKTERKKENSRSHIIHFLCMSSDWTWAFLPRTQFWDFLWRRIL